MTDTPSINAFHALRAVNALAIAGARWFRSLGPEERVRAAIRDEWADDPQVRDEVIRMVFGDPAPDGDATVPEDPDAITDREPVFTLGTRDPDNGPEDAAICEHDWWDCTCVERCDEDPATAYSQADTWHSHDDDPCPIHAPRPASSSVYDVTDEAPCDCVQRPCVEHGEDDHEWTLEPDLSLPGAYIRTYGPLRIVEVFPAGDTPVDERAHYGGGPAVGRPMGYVVERVSDGLPVFGCASLEQAETAVEERANQNPIRL